MKYIDLQNCLMQKERRYISQAEIARIIGLDKSSISLYVKNNIDLKEIHKSKIEQAFGINLDTEKHIPTVPESAEDILIERFMTNFRAVLKGDFKAYKTVKSMLKTLELTYGFVDKEE